MRKFLKEFKDFALRGNVMDLAVGVIIGAAFQSIVKSLVNDIITPLIGLFAKMDFKYLYFEIRDVKIGYGAFITELLNFIIMAFAIFLMIKAVNAVTSLGRKYRPEEPPTTRECPFCCSEITIKAVKCPNCTSDLPPLEDLEVEHKEEEDV